MSSSWKKATLSEIGTIVGGATPSTKKPEYWDGNIPWLSPKDLAGYKYRYIGHGERNITEKGLASCSTTLLPQGSILFSSRAPIGYIAVASNPVCTNQGFKSIVPNECIDSLFLYYLLLFNKRRIESLGTGTTFKEVSGSVMKQVIIEYPGDQKEQKAIASILDSIDSKIEVNQRMNDCLAELIDAVFAKRFGAIEDNAVLSDIAEITMGQSPSGKSYNEEGDGTVFYQGRAEFGWRFPTQRLFTTEPKRMAVEGDVLMSVRAPVGDINVAFENCCIGRGLAAIHSQYPSFCLYLMRSLGRKLDAYNGEGTVFGSINGKALKGLEIGLPNKNEIEEFESFAQPIDRLIRLNEKAKRCLTELRDALLQKLMSGQIDVSKIEFATQKNVQ